MPTLCFWRSSTQTRKQVAIISSSQNNKNLPIFPSVLQVYWQYHCEKNINSSLFGSHPFQGRAGEESVWLLSLFFTPGQHAAPLSLLLGCKRRPLFSGFQGHWVLWLWSWEWKVLQPMVSQQTGPNMEDLISTNCWWKKSCTTWDV